MKIKSAFLAAAAITFLAVPAANAQQCGNTSSGFNAWKAAMIPKVQSNGIGSRGVAALQNASYATKTIQADRNQKSFKLSFERFLEVRGANTIISRGKKIKGQYASLFQNIERQTGVPAGVLIAIWGMESAFGRYQGNQNLVSAVATLAYDCRRSEFFTRQLYAALQLVDRGVLSAKTVGAMHGEVGQTQFLPENVIKYAADGDGDGRIDMRRSEADALMSTARFLKGHGWRRGAGYQPGQPNFRAIQGWNAAGVYQKAIAYIAQRIDG